ncbi:MAG: DUF402 domain-containing protein [Desulfurococcaceae archaeon]
MSDKINVRIRGIFATALTKILIDSGMKIVEASDKVQERMHIAYDTSPCDVTVKDGDYQDELLVIGFSEKARNVYNILVENLKYVLKWISPIELHSVYIGIVKEKRGDTCLVDIGERVGSLAPCKENIGEKITVGVRRAPLYPGEELILTKNFRIIGKYVALLHGEPKISFSEHIRDRDTRARLSTIAASKLMNTGLGVHFRSSSKYASKEDIINELNFLFEEYKRIFLKVENANEPAKIYPGEFIGILGLTSLAKQILDNIRNTVYPTIPRHHTYKALGYADLVDMAECILREQCDRASVWRGFTKFVLSKISEKRTIELIHIKPSGERVYLSPGDVVKISHEDGDVELVIKRVFTSPGIYDGIGVEKKPGDVDYLVINSRKSFIIHNYYRGRTWLGSYININTPPEIAPGIVKYHDLLIDIVIKPDGDVKVVDKEEIDKYYDLGIITKELYELANNTVKTILKDAMSHIYNPFINSK